MFISFFKISYKRYVNSEGPSQEQTCQVHIGHQSWTNAGLWCEQHVSCVLLVHTVITHSLKNSHFVQFESSNHPSQPAWGFNGAAKHQQGKCVYPRKIPPSWAADRKNPNLNWSQFWCLLCILTQFMHVHTGEMAPSTGSLSIKSTSS